MKNVWRYGVGSVAVLGLMGLATSPALAITGPSLPDGDKLYVIECDSSDAVPLQLFGLDPETGSTTELGTGSGGVTNCGYQGAQMPDTDWFYYFDGGSHLQRVDLTTGENETIGSFTLDGSLYYNAASMTIGPDGTAYVFAYDDMYTVDLETAELTYLSSPNIYDLDSGYPYAFTYDYLTEKFYTVETGAGKLYEVDPQTGTLTELGANPDFYVYSMSFDANGDMWLNGDDDHVSKVSIADFTNSAAWQDSPDITVDSGTLYSESLWVDLKEPEALPSGGQEELAATGFPVAGYLALASALVAAGAVLLVTRKRNA